MLKIVFTLFSVTAAFPEVCLKSNIICYYEQVSKAKCAVTLNLYEDALEEYDEAFKIKKSPFFIDVRNALYIACEIKDSIRVKKYIKNLRTKGIAFGEFEDFAVCGNKFSKIIASKKNKANELLNDIINSDQAVRPSIAFLSKDQILLRDSMDHVHFRSFISMVKMYGFPTEETYGYYIGNRTLWEVVNGLFIHFILSGYNESVMEMLESNFKKGNIPNGVYASLIDRNSDSHLHGENAVEHRYLVKVGAKDYYPIFDKSSSNLDKVNKLRMSIGLDSLHISQNYYLSFHYCRYKFISGYVPEPYTSIEFLPFQIMGDETTNSDLVRINESKYKCEK